MRIEGNVNITGSIEEVEKAMHDYETQGWETQGMSKYGENSVEVQMRYYQCE